ncbi:DNA replication ATP-dependent helicase Dna2 [Chloropicon primus]|uniref:DNA replication ATP-dependent helicase/nuclease n=3 Tax=Chloropicon primus TaxID=1764295 RepID=A0A5B8MEQ6_9CHLO|nr:DNA replication ATP-dependent helicase Dna2 [Chloropicon primus]UPQ97367.1 DNA replication ATP-dependent helicase Dna2 [Chloropicon primus]|eukprot:QDZ18155.1 DNA replication ATP-dependent helicase Dna2 [Chloropicon primus]
MKKWQRDRSKKNASNGASIQSFFKPKAKLGGGGHDDGVQENNTAAEAGAKATGAEDCAKGMRRRSIGLANLGASHTSEVDTESQVLPMSQGVGIVWQNSPARGKGGAADLETQGELAISGEEREPLRDLMLCVAKPRESASAVNGKNKNKAIEDLMVTASVSPVGSPDEGSGGAKKSGDNPFARKRSARQSPPAQPSKVPRSAFTDRLEAMRRKGTSTSGRPAKRDGGDGVGGEGGRNQALFDVLKKVERAMAKKQLKKNGNGGPAQNSASKASGVPPSQKATMRFQSKEVLNAMEGMVATKKDNQVSCSAQPSAQEALVSRKVVACVVLEVFEAADLRTSFKDDALAAGMSFGDKLVRAMNAKGLEEIYLKLQGSWSGSHLGIGEELNIVVSSGAKTGDGARSLDGKEVWTISDKSENKALVRHPGRLVTGTKLSAATRCTRQAVLDEKVQNGFGYNPPAVLGNLKHEMIQRSMVRNTWTKKFFLEQIDSLVEESYESLYGAQMGLAETVNELQKFIPIVQKFMAENMALELSDLSLNSGAKGAPKAFGALGGEDKKRAALDICQIVDVEDYLTSATYGLKGVVDVSLKGRVRRNGKAKDDFGASERKQSLMPLEIKTGKEYFTHRAQLVTYVLLMEDAYGVPVNEAVMWYTGRGGPSVIPVSNQERRHIIQARNYLAGALQDHQLPNVLADRSSCSRCFSLSACMGLHKIVEGGGEKSSGIGDQYTALTSHISLHHVEYFQRWYTALCHEEEFARNRNRKEWASRGISLSLSSEAPLEVSRDSRPNHQGHCYTFRPSRGGSQGGSKSQKGSSGFSLGFDLEVGERVKLIALNLDRPLETRARVHRLTPGDESIDFIVTQPLTAYMGKVDIAWRMVRDHGSSLNGLMKGNLLDLVMEKDRKNVQRLREVIIDKASPRSVPLDSRTTLKGLSESSLNLRQKEAALSVMNAEDYALVLGTPGSGKSTVIVQIIKLLLAKGKSILVTSHTNNAVDNILMRLVEEDVDFVRIGNAKSVANQVKPYMVGGERKQIENFDAYAQLMDEAKVVGCTCYNMSHAVFMHRQFDYCIVDEASQITLPAVLGPLVRSHKFVLVGDNYQLPPLVLSPKAAMAGLGKSLFVELAEAHPESVVFFDEQYRMAQEISDLSSSLIYCNRLKCGDRGNEQRMGEASAHQADASQPEWLAACLDPEKKVVFVDTDGLGVNLERIHGTSVSNNTEADMCIEVIKSFVTLQNALLDEIGVMSVYNMQVSLLQQKVRTECTSFSDLLEIHTVDRFQGRDKDIVLISFVRSNTERHCGNLLLDWRRVNVALTRAKRKLIMIGSSSTLAGAPILHSMISMVKGHGDLVSAEG